MRRELANRLGWQLLWCIIFLSISSWMLIITTFSMPTNQTVMERFTQTQSAEDWSVQGYVDIFTDDPWEFNLTNTHQSLLERFLMSACMYYGVMRLVFVLVICIVAEREEQWTYFWELCENGPFERD